MMVYKGKTCRSEVCIRLLIGSLKTSDCSCREIQEEQIFYERFRCKMLCRYRFIHSLIAKFSNCKR